MQLRLIGVHGNSISLDHFAQLTHDENLKFGGAKGGNKYSEEVS